MRKKLFLVIGMVVAFFGIFTYDKEKGKFDIRIGSQQDGDSGLFTNQTIFKKRVYLTFDDGPSTNTKEILDILKKNHVKATFFVVGKQSPAAKKQYIRIVKEGHTLGMHAYEHDYKKIYQSVDAFSKDLKQLQQLLFETTHEWPTIYRFPGGSSNTCVDNIRPYIKEVEKMGLKYYDWNALSGDAVDFQKSADCLNRNILKDVSHESMSIVLMHDLKEAKNTVKGLDALIKSLKQQGYEILPITENTKEIHHVSVDK